MQEFCCFIVFLCQYIHSFTFPEMAGRGGYSPPSHPPKSATAQSVSANDAAVVSEPPQSPSNVLTIDSSESANLENPQVFCLAPPLLQKGGPN